VVVAEKPEDTIANILPPTKPHTHLGHNITPHQNLLAVVKEYVLYLLVLRMQWS
jgi:hypothetical protein